MSFVKKNIIKSCLLCLVFWGVNAQQYLSPEYIKVTNERASKIVAKLALCRYRTSSVWLFLPAWAESLAQAIQEELRAWGVDGVRIALVAESEGSASLKFIKEL